MTLDHADRIAGAVYQKAVEMGLPLYLAEKLAYEAKKAALEDV